MSVVTPHRHLPLRRAVTPREREVWRRVACDESDKQIAAALGIARRTVSRHREALHRKLGTHTAIGLALEAVRQGVIVIEPISA